MFVKVTRCARHLFTCRLSASRLPLFLLCATVRESEKLPGPWTGWAPFRMCGWEGPADAEEAGGREKTMFRPPAAGLGRAVILAPQRAAGVTLWQFSLEEHSAGQVVAPAQLVSSARLCASCLLPSGSARPRPSFYRFISSHDAFTTNSLC